MYFLILRDEFRGVKGDWELEGRAFLGSLEAQVYVATNNDVPGEQHQFTSSGCYIELTPEEYSKIEDNDSAKWNHV